MFFAKKFCISISFLLVTNYIAFDNKEGRQLEVGRISHWKKGVSVRWEAKANSLFGVVPAASAPFSKYSIKMRGK